MQNNTHYSINPIYYVKSIVKFLFSIPSYVISGFNYMFTKPIVIDQNKIREEKVRINTERLSTKLNKVDLSKKEEKQEIMECLANGADINTNVFCGKHKLFLHNNLSLKYFSETRLQNIYFAIKHGGNLFQQSDKTNDTAIDLLYKFKDSSYHKNMCNSPCAITEEQHERIRKEEKYTFLFHAIYIISKGNITEKEFVAFKNKIVSRNICINNPQFVEYLLKDIKKYGTEEQKKLTPDNVIESLPEDALNFYKKRYEFKVFIKNLQDMRGNQYTKIFKEVQKELGTEGGLSK